MPEGYVINQRVPNASDNQSKTTARYSFEKHVCRVVLYTNTIILINRFRKGARRKWCGPVEKIRKE